MWWCRHSPVVEEEGRSYSSRLAASCSCSASKKTEESTPYTLISLTRVGRLRPETSLEKEDIFFFLFLFSLCMGTKGFLLLLLFF